MVTVLLRFVLLSLCYKFFGNHMLYPLYLTTFPSLLRFFFCALIHLTGHPETIDLFENEWQIIPSQCFQETWKSSGCNKHSSHYKLRSSCTVKDIRLDMNNIDNTKCHFYKQVFHINGAIYVRIYTRSKQITGWHTICHMTYGIMIILQCIFL